MKGSYVIERRRAALVAELVPGEQLMLNYASDIAPCRCITHKYVGVECTSVASTDPRRGPRRGVDRCLTCGARWRSRRFSGDRVELIARAA